MTSSGPNWVLLKKVAMLCFVAVTFYSFAPWGRCTFQHMDAAQMDVLGEADSSGAVRAERGTAFMGGFFGSVRACWASYPVGDGAPWQWPAIIGSFLAIGLFERIERARYARQIRRMTSDYDAVSQVPRRRRAPPAPVEPLVPPPARPIGPEVQVTSRPVGSTVDGDGAPRRVNPDAPDWEWD